MNTDNTAPLDFLEDPQPDPARRGWSVASIAILVAFVGVIIILAVQLAQRNQPQPRAGEPAPDFTMTTFDGEPIRLSDWQGQIVIVNFWASWCAPCRAEAPDLQAIHEDYREQGVVVVGVNWLDTERNARAFMQEFGLTYWNAPDVGDIVGNRYNIQGAPENFIIGRDGIVVTHIIGAVDYNRLARHLDALLDAES